MNLSNYTTDELKNDIYYAELLIKHLRQAIESDRHLSSLGIARKEVTHLDSVLMSMVQAGEQFVIGKMSHCFLDCFGKLYDWHMLIAFRNQVANSYETVNAEQSWLVLDEDVPEALEAAEYVLDEMRRELSRRDV